MTCECAAGRRAAVTSACRRKCNQSALQAQESSQSCSTGMHHIEKRAEAFHKSKNLTEQSFIETSEGIDKGQRQEARGRMAPMIQWRRVAFTLRQAIKLPIRQSRNISAAEAAADEVRLSG